MSIAPDRVLHLELARREGLVPDAGALVWRQDPAPHVRTDFVIERTLLNRASIWLSRYPRLQRLVYHSALSGGIYGVVDRFRSGSAQADLVKAKREGRYTRLPLDR
jgi:hypothetical protein